MAASVLCHSSDGSSIGPRGGWHLFSLGWPGIHLLQVSHRLYDALQPGSFHTVCATASHVSLHPRAYLRDGRSPLQGAPPEAFRNKDLLLDALAGVTLYKVGQLCACQCFRQLFVVAVSSIFC